MCGGKGKIDNRAGLPTMSKTPGTSEQNANFSFFPAQGSVIMQEMKVMQCIEGAGVHKTHK